jgi:MoxR-like ATPase
MKFLNRFGPIAISQGSPCLHPGYDLRDGSIYVCNDSTVLAVNVALCTHRPLLICGPSGCGKSSLAPFVARTMNWNYFEQAVTSRTQARDLQWSFDAVKRLRDAHANELRATAAYVEPGALWWAFNPDSARRRGIEGKLPRGVREACPMGVIRGRDHPSVVLLDEIDKADPDVPNDLLVVLGSQQIAVTESQCLVTPQQRPLVVITSNNERSLPRAFLRRCVVHSMKAHTAAELVEIGMVHFGEVDERKALYTRLAEKVVELAEAAGSDSDPSPSTAEYLDAVLACIELGVEPGDSLEWQAIESATMTKRIL